jgi:hypothetical protein
MRTALSVALILFGVSLIFAWRRLGYVVGGCFAMAGVLMFALEMQRRRAMLLAPADQLLRAIPTEVAAMLPSALPSPRVRMLNRAFSWGMLALSIMGLYSIFLSNFVPAPTTVAVAKVLTSAVGVSYAVFFVGFEQFGWDPQNPKVVAAVAQRPILGKVYVRAPFMAVVFAGFAWMSFSNVLPLALTAIVGKQGSMAVVVKGWERASFSGRSGSSCARPTLDGVPFGMLGRQALCVGDQRSESDFPPGSTLLLVGRASALGIIPDRYRVDSSSTSN